MSVETANQLKQHLFDAYGGRADKRIRDIERNDLFIVDDRGQSDYDAHKQLFLWFTLMFVNVRSANEIELLFRGGTPRGKEVSAWFAKHDAKTDKNSISVTLKPENLGDLDDLAAAFLKITQRRYDTPAYTYVVPRVASSVRQLRNVLGRAWN